MDVRLRVLGRVELEDPVDGREVEAARGDVRGEEHGVLHRREALERREARHLLLLAVEVQERHAGVHLAERLEREADLLAARHEHERLRLQVALDEAPEHVQLFVELAENVVLLEGLGGRTFRQSFLDAHSDWVFETEAREVCD